MTTGASTGVGELNSTRPAAQLPAGRASKADWRQVHQFYTQAS